MTIHAFPVDPSRRARRDGPVRSGADRVERALIGGLVCATAVQFALVAIFWLA